MLTINLLRQDPKVRRLVSRRRAGRKYWLNNREKVKARRRAAQPQNTQYHRAWRLRNLYKLTPEQHAQMLAQQGGVCATCKKPKRLDIDHDHANGDVRGLLCNTCNRALGLVYDDPALLRRMADYLEKK